MIIIVSISNIVNIVIEANVAEKLLVAREKVKEDALIETMTMLALRLMLVILVIQITGVDHEEGWRN